MIWTAEFVAAVVARQVFQRELVCPNCTWTGHEADLLVVHASLRLIDVEVKVSRADLKADLEKMKWWCQWPVEQGQDDPEKPRQWPPKIWKHYFVMPAEIWKAELLEALPAASGVLTISEIRPWIRQARAIELADLQPVFGVKTVRRAKPNRQAEKISAADAVNIARLASIRYWQVLAGKASRWSDQEVAA